MSMKIMVIDDEPIALNGIKKSIDKIQPEAEVTMFQAPSEAIEWAKNNRADVVLSDIQMQGMDGIELAKRIKDFNKNANIIFCTGYEDYLKDAFDLYASGYLLKPITPAKLKDALDNLRYPIEETSEKKIKVRCFGDFEVFYDGKPLIFKHSKTKELFAYLVDRCGTACNIAMTATALFEDDGHEAYFYKLRNDLVSKLQEIGCEDILSTSYGKVSIVMDQIDCDYYDCLNGKDPKYEAFNGEYMNQYSWAEYTLANIENKIDRMQ